MTSIAQAFGAIEHDDRWANMGALGDAEIAELERKAGRPVPSAVEELVRYTVSSEWAGKRLVQFLSLIGLIDVNRDFSEYGLPVTAFAFASDGGSGLYFVDADDHFGKGSGAVFRVGAGSLAPAEAKYVAPSLPAFIGWMIAGG